MSAINISTQTAEVKTITHHKDLSESVHEALWYTTEEWGEMEGSPGLVPPALPSPTITCDISQVIAIESIVLTPL